MRAKNLCTVLLAVLLLVATTSSIALAGGGPFGVQDQVLNKLSQERAKVTIVMISGDRLEGFINTFDKQTILVESDGDILIYKHAIISISSSDGNFMLSTE